MRKILSLLFILICSYAFAQPAVNRAGAANTVADANLFALRSFRLPVYADTTAANNAYPTLDSAGKVFYSFNDKAIWLRQHSPKKWVKLADQNLVNNVTGCYGLLNGGVVTWSGTGLVMNVTASYYVINCNYYNADGSLSITLATADPTNPRIDVIAVDTSENIVVITGTPGATPVKPQVNPTYQVELTEIYVPAGATTPQNYTYKTVYNENAEWTSGSALTTGTANFNSTVFPSVGTKNLRVSPGAIGHVYWDTTAAYISSNYQSISLRLSFASSPTNDIVPYIYLRDNGVQVTYSLSLDGFGYSSVSGVNEYVVITIPISAFTFTSGSTFDGIGLYFGGIGAIIDVDYVQLQTGTNGGGVIGNYLEGVRRLAGGTDVEGLKNGVWQYLFTDSIGSGGGLTDTTSLSNRIDQKQNIADTNTVDATRYWASTNINNANIGNGYRLANPSNRNLKTVRSGQFIKIDSSSNENSLTITNTDDNKSGLYLNDEKTYLRRRAYLIGDSLVSAGNSFAIEYYTSGTPWPTQLANYYNKTKVLIGQIGDDIQGLIYRNWNNIRGRALTSTWFVDLAYLPVLGLSSTNNPFAGYYYSDGYNIENATVKTYKYNNDGYRAFIANYYLDDWFSVANLNDDNFRAGITSDSLNGKTTGAIGLGSFTFVKPEGKTTLVVGAYGSDGTRISQGTIHVLQVGTYGYDTLFRKDMNNRNISNRGNVRYIKSGLGYDAIVLQNLSPEQKNITVTITGDSCRLDYIGYLIPNAAAVKPLYINNIVPGSMYSIWTVTKNQTDTINIALQDAVNEFRNYPVFITNVSQLDSFTHISSAHYNSAGNTAVADIYKKNIEALKQPPQTSYLNDSLYYSGMWRLIGQFRSDRLISYGSGNINTNQAVGYQSLYSNTTGSEIVATGALALYSNTTGRYNTGTGYQSLYSNTTGEFNSAFGRFSLQHNTTGHRNFAGGTNSLYSNTTGSDNTGVGVGAMEQNLTGNECVGIGKNALLYHTTGDGVNGIGWNAGSSVTTGSYSDFFGYSAGYGGSQKTDVYKSIAIGYNSYTTKDSQAVFGGDHIKETWLKGNVGIGTSSPSAKLDVNGTIKITGGSPGIGKVLTSDADGLASWQTVSGGSSGISVGATTITGSVNGSFLYDSSGYVSRNDAAYFDITNKRVGIGTKSPGYKLDVDGDIRIKDGSYLKGGGVNLIGYSSVSGQTYVGGAAYITSLNAGGYVTFGSGKAGVDVTDGNTCIGNTVANSKAMLQVNSTTKGFLPPRMTKTQRNAISSITEPIIVIVTGETGGEYLSIYNVNHVRWEKVSTVAD